MKKALTMSALAAVVLTGCTGNSVGFGIGSSGSLGVGAGVSLPIGKPVTPLKEAQGVVLEMVLPNYPAQYQTLHREGEVQATFDLTEDGVAENIMTEGDDIFGTQVKHALRRTKFATGKSGRYSTTYYFRQPRSVTTTRPLGVYE